MIENQNLKIKNSLSKSIKNYFNHIFSNSLHLIRKFIFLFNQLIKLNQNKQNKIPLKI